MSSHIIQAHTTQATAVCAAVDAWNKGLLNTTSPAHIARYHLKQWEASVKQWQWMSQDAKKALIDNAYDQLNILISIKPQVIIKAITDNHFYHHPAICLHHPTQYQPIGVTLNDLPYINTKDLEKLIHVYTMEHSGMDLTQAMLTADASITSLYHYVCISESLTKAINHLYTHFGSDIPYRYVLANDEVILMPLTSQ